MSQAGSIDPDEVAYYDRLADQWWDPDGRFWPIHHLNRLRVDYLRHRICLHFGRAEVEHKPLEGLRVLDIGCGGGILSESMAGLGARVHAIDVAGKNIEVAKRHNEASGLPIEYELVSVEQLAERDKRYDVVLNMEVVEHVADLPSFLAACTRLVDPGGLMFIATINRNPLAWFTAIFGAEYVLGWLPKGTHQYRKLVKPGELEELLGRDAMQVTDRRGVRVNPLTRGFSLTDSLRVNYMIEAGFRAAIAQDEATGAFALLLGQFATEADAEAARPALPAWAQARGSVVLLGGYTLTETASSPRSDF